MRPQASFGCSARARATIAALMALGIVTAAGPGCVDGASADPGCIATSAALGRLTTS
jgi:hypothetical protein